MWDIASSNPKHQSHPSSLHDSKLPQPDIHLHQQPQSEPSSTAPADFPATKLVRQLDFTGFSESAAASSAEQPQVGNPSHPGAPWHPELAKSSQPPNPVHLHPSQMVFMTVQQPPQLVAPPAHPSFRPLV